MDAELADLLRSSLARLLAEAGRAGADDFARRLDDLGWSEIPPADQPEAVQLLFEAKGEAAASADALTPLLAAGLAGALGADLAAACHVGLPSSLRSGPPTCHRAGATLVVDAVTLSEPSALVVPVDDGGGIFSLAVVRQVPERLARSPIAGLDPDLGLWRVTGHIALSETTVIDGPLAVRAWEDAVAVGRRALAAELTAISARLVQDAAEYSRTRHQYGRPVGSFQAVQHQLADAHVAVVGARIAVVEATADGSAWTSLVAKALAGRAFDLAARTAQQTFGAIGFTWEHHLHRYLRRGMVLDAVFGDWRRLEAEIGQHLLATRSLPRMGRLWSNDEEN